MDPVPVFSQIKSFAQWAIAGDSEGARETQIQFVKGLRVKLDYVPVVGPLKGAVHYVCGDEEGGDNAVKASFHTTGVIGGGVTGFMVGGPVGAAAGVVAGGFVMDFRFVEDVLRITKDPKDGGNYVDLIGRAVLDVMPESKIRFILF
ncbi:hypothetical protein ACJMK2_022990 [Sinanodonta woodiana]|uniref:Uncharacterized protein n=1 Tax=Sinanodonta woodiana TaxID=1069815 RepID=A0ABD3TKR2_SINWO